LSIAQSLAISHQKQPTCSILAQRATDVKTPAHADFRSVVAECIPMASAVSTAHDVVIGHHSRLGNPQRAMRFRGVRQDNQNKGQGQILPKQGHGVAPEGVRIESAVCFHIITMALTSFCASAVQEEILVAHCIPLLTLVESNRG